MNCHICKTSIGWGEKRYDAFECQIKQINKINKKIKGVKNVKRRNERINREVGRRKISR